MRELASVLYIKIYRVRIREIILLAAERLKSRQTIFPSWHPLQLVNEAKF